MVGAVSKGTVALTSVAAPEVKTVVVLLRTNLRLYLVVWAAEEEPLIVKLNL